MQMCKKCSLFFAAYRKRKKGIQCHVLKLQILDFFAIFYLRVLHFAAKQTNKILFKDISNICLFIITVAVFYVTAVFI